MAKRISPARVDADNPEWTKEDFARARPAAEVLPKILNANVADRLLKRKPGQRGPQKKPTKVPVTLRVDSQVLMDYKAQGPGWQTHMNQVLAAAAPKNPARAQMRASKNLGRVNKVR